MRSKGSAGVLWLVDKLWNIFTWCEGENFGDVSQDSSYLNVSWFVWKILDLNLIHVLRRNIGFLLSATFYHLCAIQKITTLEKLGKALRLYGRMSTASYSNWTIQAATLSLFPHFSSLTLPFSLRNQSNHFPRRFQIDTSPPRVENLANHKARQLNLRINTFTTLMESILLIISRPFTIIFRSISRLMWQPINSFSVLYWLTNGGDNRATHQNILMNYFYIVAGAALESKIKSTLQLVLLNKHYNRRNKALRKTTLK
jgi:hypothetical protein